MAGDTWVGRVVGQGIAILLTLMTGVAGGRDDGVAQLGCGVWGWGQALTLLTGVTRRGVICWVEKLGEVKG